MVTADEYTTPAPPDVAWEAHESCLRCMVGWPAGRPPPTQVLPLLAMLTVGVQVLRDLCHAVGVRE
jgi:hypothetical protein